MKIIYASVLALSTLTFAQAPKPVAPPVAAPAPKPVDPAIQAQYDKLKDQYDKEQYHLQLLTEKLSHLQDFKDLQQVESTLNNIGNQATSLRQANPQIKP